MVRARSTLSGFTLIELLVTISVMALMTLLSWRGIDGMLRTKDQLSARSDQVLTLQTALTQWTVDLDNLAETRAVSAVDYDGSVLRMTRRDAVSPAEGLRVVAWARRQVNGSGFWVRWQSPNVRTQADLLAAWAKAQQWGRAPTPEDLALDVPLAVLSDWQLFYYRDNAWSNPLSTAADPNQPVASGLNAPPKGVRLVLALSPGQPFAGVLTRDWVRPLVGGGKSL